MMVRQYVVFLGLLSTFSACSAEAPAASANEVAIFSEVNGNRYQLPLGGDARALVLLFVGTECPISNSYAPEIGRLYAEFQPQEFEFCVIYSEAGLLRETATRHAREFRWPCPAILDPELNLATRVGARVMPEAAVLSPQGAVLYCGRIDDRYVDFGKRREQLTSRDLHAALTAIAAGKPIETKRTTAIGCDLPSPSNNSGK